jgi:hypothetical protein
MPTIAWFYGIAIRMYVKDHPPPHFQAVYAEYEANVSIDTGDVIEGALPRAAARLVKEWTLAHQQQLRDNWRRARAGEQPEKIAGLDADKGNALGKAGWLPAARPLQRRQRGRARLHRNDQRARPYARAVA